MSEDKVSKGAGRKRASGKCPCPVCGGKDGCSEQSDGLIHCRRRTGDQPGFKYLGQSKADPQWALYRREDDPRLNGERNGSAKHKTSSPARDWATIARQCKQRLTETDRQKLTAQLGVPETGLAELHVGYGDDHAGAFYTFPQVDGDGRIIGITRRYADGRKHAMAGGKQGIYLPGGLPGRLGPDAPLLLVEGASDAAALAAMGLPAIGRPSNAAGVEHIIRFLSSLPADKCKRVVVLGEYDPKPDGSWPGKDGAVATAAKLQEAHPGLTVEWALPPCGCKDIRAWAQQSLRLDTTGRDAWQDAGDRLIRELKCQRLDKPTTTDSAVSIGFRWEPTDSRTFAERNCKPEFLIRKVLVKSQPMIVGGPKKSLKTSLMCDMAVSLASGTPFLGHFAVGRPVRTILLSGESGEWTLQETAKRICKARGFELADIEDMLLWQFTLPALARPTDLGALTEGLARDQVEANILDPLYLSLLNGQGPNGVRPENMYEMGPLLMGVSRACLDVGCTPILIHHTKRASATKVEPIDLDDLAYAGIAEFARQWLLLSRREPYEPGTGSHRLWVSVGGSTGHGGLWSADIEEGTIDDNFEGRRWEVTVATATEARQTEKATKLEEKASKKREQEHADETTLLAALDSLDQGHEGVSYNRVYERSGLSKLRMRRATDRLIDQKIVVETPVMVKIGMGATKESAGLKRMADDEQP